jgi:hypothetical protein
MKLSGELDVSWPCRQASLEGSLCDHNEDSVLCHRAAEVQDWVHIKRERGTTSFFARSFLMGQMMARLDFVPSRKESGKGAVLP